MMAVRPEDVCQFHDPERALAKLRRIRADEALRETMLAAARVRSNRNCWFAITVANRRDQAVATALESAGVAVWMPMRTVEITLARKRRPVRRAVPVFDGYLFVNVVPEAAAFGALSLFDGVTSIVGQGEEPTRLRDEYISSIKMLVEVGAFNDGPRPAFVPGDLVEVKEGPFAFMAAVVQGYRGSIHLRCLVQIFGRSTPATIPIADLIKIG